MIQKLIRRRRTNPKEDTDTDGELRLLESGEQSIRNNRTIFRGTNNRVKYAKIVGLFILCAFCIEYWKEHQELVSRQSIHAHLEMIPSRCRKYLKHDDEVSRSTASASHTENYGFSLMSYFNLWMQELEVTECKRFIEELDRKRVKLTWPNPVFVAMQSFSRLILIPLESTGESVGKFFHSLLHPQDSFLEELLIIAVVVFMILMWFYRDKLNPRPLIWIKPGSRVGFDKESEFERSTPHLDEV